VWEPRSEVVTSLLADSGMDVVEYDKRWVDIGCASPAAISSSIESFFSI
jgi:hypothetical protein